MPATPEPVADIMLCAMQAGEGAHDEEELGEASFWQSIYACLQLFEMLASSFPDQACPPPSSRQRQGCPHRPQYLLSALACSVTSTRLLGHWTHESCASRHLQSRPPAAGMSSPCSADAQRT